MSWLLAKTRCYGNVYAVDRQTIENYGAAVHICVVYTGNIPDLYTLM